MCGFSTKPPRCPVKVHRCLLDIREDDLETLHLLEQEGTLHLPPALQPFLRAYAAHVARRLPGAVHDSFNLQVEHFASPDSSLSENGFFFFKCAATQNVFAIKTCEHVSDTIFFLHPNEFSRFFLENSSVHHFRFFGRLACVCPRSLPAAS